MCTNATNKLIVNQQLILDQPETFFEKYTRKNDYEIYINEREIIYVVKTNDNIPIATFLKCVLKRYLKEKNQQARFNTCMRCGKFTYTPVLEKFEF
ncbi:6904_t:CDS:1, partial [Gigaspora margarita]